MVDEINNEESECLYLEVGEVFCHESVDLADGQTSCSAALQRHEDQDAAATRGNSSISASQGQAESSDT